ncbi:Iron(III) dicitrate transport system permease protein FecD (TC 3.A.1.14.1) [Vagococcus fluvialis bH819]|uniref:Iron(III) dicitrate transport system permease protein FecD (TC 3.A.1.14.1) n=1 Tax=Vagococcus fluvialis bH819 TaxID=1255619 RepID=A0A1X6WKP9_9ENTE|nr:Iron(III) dicitrate transport system permease protein FecD (TC 3.A.1.14.1) [Vagococcus fluvialis bH819]
MFWKHSKQHSSKTILNAVLQRNEFWKHSKQHSSKTSIFHISF